MRNFAENSAGFPENRKSSSVQCQPSTTRIFRQNSHLRLAEILHGVLEFVGEVEAVGLWGRGGEAGMSRCSLSSTHDPELDGSNVLRLRRIFLLLT